MDRLTPSQAILEAGRKIFREASPMEGSVALALSRATWDLN